VELEIFNNEIGGFGREEQGIASTQTQAKA
jgi:hypothetical protein